jgi:hypothetical protein
MTVEPLAVASRAVPGDPALSRLLGLFPDSPLAQAKLEAVAPELVPAPYAKLLVHRHHMTVTLESHHGTPVRLEVLDRWRRGDEYARRLVLRGGPQGRVVLLGLVHLHLHFLDAEAQRQVVEESAPLGRILIARDVLRWIQPRRYYRIPLSPELRQRFETPGALETYGRSASIVCHNAPAVELFEVVAPEA